MAQAPEPFRIGRSPDGQRGLPDGVTEWDLRSSRYRRLFARVHVDASATITLQLLASAALLLTDGEAAASHHTAARLWGGIVPDDGQVHLACLGRRPQVEGIRAHQARSPMLTTSRKGVRLTTPAQTFVDLSNELGLVDLVVLGDSLIKARHATLEGLVAAATGFTGRSRRLARRAASLVRRDVDSPMESRLRMLIVLAGLPEPIVNYPITDGRDAVIWKFDLSYPTYRLAIEYDGLHHAEPTQRGRDVGRREWMDNHDWRLIVALSRDLYNTPARTLQRIITAMRDRGMTVPRLSEEWRVHFPSRSDDIAAPA